MKHLFLLCLFFLLPLPSNSCQGEHDKALIKSVAFDSILRQCQEAGFFRKALVQLCLEHNPTSPLTTQCASCFGAFSECQMNNCSRECFHNFNGITCKQCSDIHCTDSFLLCSERLPIVGSAPPHCATPKNALTIYSPGWKPFIISCFLQKYFDTSSRDLHTPQDISQCMDHYSVNKHLFHHIIKTSELQEEWKADKACVNCHSFFFQCALSYCYEECMTYPFFTTEGCKTCLNKNEDQCGDALKVCTGLDFAFTVDFDGQLTLPKIESLGLKGILGPVLKKMEDFDEGAKSTAEKKSKTVQTFIHGLLTLCLVFVVFYYRSLYVDAHSQVERLVDESRDKKRD